MQMKNRLKKSVSKKSLRFFFLPFFSAVLTGLSFPKANLSILIFFAFIPLFWITAEKEKKILSLFKISLFFGIPFYSILLYWIVYTLVKYGQIPYPLAIIILLILSTYLSLYYFLFLYLASFLDTFSRPSFFKGMLAGNLYVALEFLRSTLLTGFPWGLTGYPLSNFSLFLQVADLFGIWGLSFMVFIVNYYFYFLYKGFSNFTYKSKNFLLQVLLFGMLILLIPFYGYYSKQKWMTLLNENKETLRVSILQGNIPQELKEAKEIEISLKTYQSLTINALKERPNLIFYPETALPFYFPYDREPTLKYLSFLQDLYLRVSAENIKPFALIFGIFRVSFTEGIPKVHNSLLVWTGSNVEDLYDKEKLVPFGEYVPLVKYFPFLKRISVVSDIIKPGESKNLNIPFSKGNLQIVPLICFESAFSQILVKRLQKGGELIFIATNDAWFGKTSAPYQHFQMALVRAVEGRRFTLQSANTGISGIIDPLGRVVFKSDLEKEEILSGEIKLFRYQSFFQRYGYLFPYIALIISGLFLILKIAKKFSPFSSYAHLNILFRPLKRG
ncbi:apolipoprotein N-acyltransferase [Caldimicrobium thiodismutans]|uniref:Apolipoprotein N-acyltransferase n=1 Tax=Caldimicrobium thiodismutans TaxID=1653476 RepID=A0A0U5B384_9BACT|nr:apolipoprotein N-acyltransferase [Caldimicrobium thiodismutans]BAU22448.1 apolipoprotein N-acyltransferase [Caldimicrobium thiodismutans]